MEGLKTQIDKYLEYEQIPEHKQHVKKLIEGNDLDSLEHLLSGRLAFGTAGIRGRMGPGFTQMNDLVIIQTSQGLVDYMLETTPDVKEKGVVIGNDARHNSDRFARLAALAFLQKDIPVYFSECFIPTPLIAFGVRYFSCCAGIVITASHNPKQDNGYKLYGSNGAQILSPHDKNIQKCILKDANQRPWPQAWQHELILNSSDEKSSSHWKSLLKCIYAELSEAYFSYISSSCIEEHNRIDGSGITITYTTMHGVGHKFLSRALKIAGFMRTYPVESQREPNPEFPTVRFPNPEEAGALDLAFETARLTNSHLILANDPDADRCGAAIYNPKTGRKRILNGNEIGTLLGWWKWFNFDEVATSTNESRLSSTRRDSYMISTAVSSKFLQTMAQVEGFQFVETLTGFKYMGNISDELMKQGKTVLFAYEEAIGYMVNSSILDKDGITAAIQLAQCAAFVKSKYNRDLEEQLDWLHSTYGYHYNVNSYYLCWDQALIREIFIKLQSNYPKNFGDEFPVTRVRDLNNGFDSGESDQKAKLPSSSGSFMVTFFVGNDITITIRTSGTEPKIKFYSEIVSKLPSRDNDTTEQLRVKEAAQIRLHKLVDAAVEHCLKPKLYSLQPADQ